VRDVPQADGLEDRLIDFAVRIIILVDALPDSPVAKKAKEKLAMTVDY